MLRHDDPGIEENRKITRQRGRVGSGREQERNREQMKQKMHRMKIDSNLWRPFFHSMRDSFLLGFRFTQS